MIMYLDTEARLLPSDLPWILILGIKYNISNLKDKFIWKTEIIITYHKLMLNLSEINIVWKSNDDPAFLIQLIKLTWIYINYMKCV